MTENATEIARQVSRETGLAAPASPENGAVGPQAQAAGQENEAVSQDGPASRDTASQDTGSQDTGSQDTGSQDTGSQDTGSQDTGSQDTGSQDTGSQENGAAPLAGGLSPETEDLLEALRDVVDPELGINVVDLGLVYGLTVGEDRVATIDMTLTSAACPLTDVIEDQTRDALEGLVSDFRINWVWLPPWGPDKITEDGREQLRALGFNV